MIVRQRSLISLKSNWKAGRMWKTNHISPGFQYTKASPVPKPTTKVENSLSYCGQQISFVLDSLTFEAILKQLSVATILLITKNNENIWNRSRQRPRDNQIIWRSCEKPVNRFSGILSGISPTTLLHLFAFLSCYVQSAPIEFLFRRQL